MSRRPYMKLYVSDFLGDTMALTTEEVGAYLLILMHYWSNGPSTEAEMRRVARVSRHKWCKFSTKILRFFVEENGKFLHRRMDAEISKALDLIEKRAEYGRKGGLAKALANGKQKPTYPEPEKKNTGDLAVADTAAAMWREGVALLMQYDMSERNARALIGQLAKAQGDADTCLRLIRAAQQKANPETYLRACCKPKPNTLPKAMTWCSKHGVEGPRMGETERDFLARIDREYTRRVRDAR